MCITSWQNPRIPKSRVAHAILSGENQKIADKLRNHGITAVLTEKDNRLPRPVAYHPDMQMCLLDTSRTIVLKGETVLQNQLLSLGYQVTETTKEPQASYPKDILCNALILHGVLFGRLNALDKAILNYATQQNLTQVNVKQGYTACSVCVVNESAAITADAGIAKALKKHDIEVLLIRNGFISLHGYDTGFIGGCCGLIAENELVCSGSLEKHPDGNMIRKFLQAKGVQAIELLDEPLLDIGGIIPLY